MVLVIAGPAFPWAFALALYAGWAAPGRLAGPHPPDPMA
jgi:hypothetical protein